VSASPLVGINTFDFGAVTGASVAAELFDLFTLAADVRYQRGFSRFGTLNGGLRHSVWALAIRVSGLGAGGGGQPYLDAPIPSDIQGVPLVPVWTRPVRGVRM
jgi:hypothetical protein